VRPMCFGSAAMVPMARRRCRNRHRAHCLTRNVTEEVSADDWDSAAGGQPLRDAPRSSHLARRPHLRRRARWGGRKSPHRIRDQRDAMRPVIAAPGGASADHVGGAPFAIGAPRHALGQVWPIRLEPAPAHLTVRSSRCVHGTPVVRIPPRQSGRYFKAGEWRGPFR
jgi:hypothetical protein